MPDAVFIRGSDDVRLTAAASLTDGECWQLPDGRAAVFQGQGNGASSGDRVAFKATGQHTMTKKPSVVCLDGGRAWWDHANNHVTPLKPQSGRGFFLGLFVGDAAAADATCAVNLNMLSRYAAHLRDGVWVTEATNGLGVLPLFGGGAKLAFDAVNEVAQAAIYSERTIPVAANPIFEARFAVADKGDDAALDMDIGLANGSHATDFEAITEFVAIHFDGNDLSIKAHSDDGTTDVPPTDTLVDAAEGTFVEVWIDAREPANVKLYVDAVRVLPATVFRLDNATGPLKPIAMIEKTADDTLADLRIDFTQVRTSEQ